MIIEVFKDYDQALRLFDSVRYNEHEPPGPGDFVGWQFNSKNKRDRGDTYINDMAQVTQPADTIYFDSTQGNYKLASTVKNVVLDYHAPELVSWSGKYTAFKAQSGHSGRHTSDELWSAELVFRDDSGIDDGSYSILMNGIPAVTSTRKNSEGPYWLPAVTYNYDLLDDRRAVKVNFERGSTDSSIYRVTITIDPDKLTSQALRSCNDYISYVEMRVKIYDIAGNVLNFKIPVAFVLYQFETEEIVESIKRLKLDFVDTYPSNLFVDADVIGKTKIRAYNENRILTDMGFSVKFGLKSDSVGYLSGLPEVEDELSIQQVDGIDRTGDVKAYAYLDGSNQGEIFCSIPSTTIQVVVDKSLAELVKSATYAEAVLGTFVSECLDNVRKINVDPFVPSVLKNEGIYGLCKLYERFLNTMYTPVGELCKIGVLEKIARIGKMKDPDSCEAKLLPNFFEEHGSELKFSREDLQKVATSIFNHLPDNTNKTIESVLTSIYRRYAALLPYIDRWKGTDRCFEILFKAVGMDTSIIQLWENANGDMVPEDEAGDDFSLSSHLRLVLNSREYTKREMRAMLPFAYKAAKSVLPVNRVLDDIYILETYELEPFDGAMTAVDASIERLSPSEKIRFSWNSDSVVNADITTTKIRIRLPIRADNSESPNSSDEYPVADNCSFFFVRWNISNRSREDKSLKLSFRRNGDKLTEIAVIPSNVIIQRNSVIIEADYTASNMQAANVFNSYIADSTVTVESSFEFNRAVDNYCISISASEYEA